MSIVFHEKNSVHTFLFMLPDNIHPSKDSIAITKKMKLYIISGLCADFTVLSHIKYPESLEPVFIPWLMPNKKEKFQDYIARMTADIDESQPFALLGYSMGGIVVQEIDKRTPAEKVIIIASAKAHKEMPKIARMLRFFPLNRVPLSVFKADTKLGKYLVRNHIEKDLGLAMKYTAIADNHYIRWHLHKASRWRFEKNPKVIQIMGTEDIAFPIKNAKPDYVVEDGSHLFPVTHAEEVTDILADIFKYQNN